MTSTLRSPARTLLALTLLALGAGAAAAQQAPDGEPLEVERVYVPEAGFDRVIKRYPRGVVVAEGELQELLRRAGLKPAPAPAAPPAPVPFTIRQTQVTGAVAGAAGAEVAELAAECEVAVLAPGTVAVPLPLAGLGVRAVTVDGAPARLVAGPQGPRVLLEGPTPEAAAAGQAALRVVAWTVAARVAPGEERGAGAVTLPVPASAAGRLVLDVPGDVEPIGPAGAAPLGAQNQQNLSRAPRPQQADVAEGASSVLAWAEPAGRAGATRLHAAFGNALFAAPGAGQGAPLVLAWRPRRAQGQLTPYVVADDRSAFLVRPGVVVLESAVLLEVYRAGRDRFAVDLPPGFVVRSLAVEREEVTYVQRGDRVEVALSGPRLGALSLRLRAELSIGDLATAGAEGEKIALRPLAFPDVDRASGLVGVAQGEGAVLAFERDAGLERADLAELGPAPAPTQNAQGPTGERLLRVYRRGRTPAALDVAARPLAPKVDLDVLAAIQLEERELRALAAWRFRVEEGRVFSVRAALEAGWTIDSVVVRDGAGNAPPHELRQEDAAVTVELPRGLRPGEELLVTLQATREVPGGLAGQRVGVPRLTGSPATRVHGHVGFAPDQAFRLTGADLSALTPIPALELPNVGLAIPGLVLGYRIEAPEYQGALLVTPRETRVSSQVTAYHRVAERVVETDATLALTVDGAPITKLDLLLPKGVGRAARIEGVELGDDRELVGEEGGRERWRLTLDPRRAGAFALRVRFSTTLAGDEKDGVTQADLPQVSLAGAFRERGAVAVFSSDATELTARPKGLRTIEVTDVPSLPGTTFEGRPLVAYTFVGPYELGVSIRRHGAAPTLSAVVEHLALASTVGADGSGRHVATFSVRHLRAQFFALRLPADATLWSVVVNGQGVKPARKDGLELVPMPEAATGEGDTVVVTYTRRTDPWGALGRTAQEAPELRLSSDVGVPVLRTTWDLSLPDDYRVLELHGNLAGPGVGAVRPLAATAWRAITAGGGLPWLAALLLVLGVGASEAARGRLVVALAALVRGAGRTRAAGRAAATGSGAALGRLVRSKVLWLVVGLLCAGMCLVSFVGTMLKSRSKGGVYRTAAAPRDDYEYEAASRFSGGGAGGAPATPAPAGPVGKTEARGEAAKESEDARDLLESAQELADADKNLERSRERRRDALDGAPPPPPPAPPAAAAPAPEPRPEAPRRQRPRHATPGRPGLAGRGAANGPGAPAGAKDDASGVALEEESAEGGEAFADAPMDDEADERLKGDAGGLDAPKPAQAPAETKAEAPESPPATTTATTGAVIEDEKKKAREELAKAPASEVLDATVEAVGAQVGLRSLVLALPPLGQQARFFRPGGGAVLEAEVVREDALQAAAALLAVLGLGLGLGVPRLTRVGYLGLLVVALAAVTATPHLAAAAKLTPLCNALALGLVAAAPVHAALAFGRAWDRRPLARLAAAVRAVNAPAPAGAGRAAAVALALGLALGGATPARADEAPAPQGPPRVFVPYDPAKPDAVTGRVFVPEDLYQDLWRRAYPDRVPVARPAPLAPTVVTQVEYEGGLEGERLTLEARVTVDVLAEGWQRCALGLAGCGLEASKVARAAGAPVLPPAAPGRAPAGEPARVVAAPAGGFELSAPGPATYQLTLRLVVPRREGGWVFATVPAAAAQLRVKARLGDRRIDVGGARAQVERPLAGGETLTDASLGDAPRVQLALGSREVLTSGGASEAAGTTQSIVWVRRGRVVVLSQTTFQVSGAGREGFLFELPPGLAVTSVQTEALRAWRLDEQGRLEVSLRRPTGARHTVAVAGELLLPEGTTRVKAPHVVASGVSRDAGTVGIVVDPGLRVRAVDPPAGLRQVDARSVADLAARLRAPAVEKAYEFARRPVDLELELVTEAVEVKADTDVRAVVLADRALVRAQVAWDVRRGRVYELAVQVPAEYELASAGGLDIRETTAAVSGAGAAAVRTLRFGLAAGLAGPARLDLVLERRALVRDGEAVPFPDVRPLGVSLETTSVAVGAAGGLKLRAKDEPAGFQARDARATRAEALVEGAEWLLAWQRPAARGPGLARAPLTVLRPTARVEGSWVLHAMLERDVVRYTLRALATIQGAGATTFHALVPAAVADRVSVEATNLRETRTAKVDEATARVTVELQSPAEGFYDFALSWEELLPAADTPWALPRVGLDQLDRQVRGFVLVEKAADVPDLLEVERLEGAIAEGRASDAPALPPGRTASSFGRFAYRVDTKAAEPWAASLKLRAREVRLPPAARIPWAQLTSVFTPDGLVRHRVVYRVRNLRLQFLALRLPPGAEVWSAFVAGAPKRIHQDGERTLVPLPKRTDADLSFDVELTYATPLAEAFGFGTKVEAAGPTLDTPEVTVERTFWTLHVPEGYDVSGLAGTLKPAAAATSQVQALAEELSELKKLSELASSASGNAREVAAENIEAQRARVLRQLETCDALGPASGEDGKLLAANRADVSQVERALAERKAKEQVEQLKQQQEALGVQQEVVVEGNNFQRLQSGWYSNEQVLGKANQTQWAGLPQSANAPVGGQPGAPGAEQTWTLAVPEGQSLDLKNAEVFRANGATNVAEQQAQGQQYKAGRRMLQNRGYDAGDRVAPGEDDQGMTQLDPPALALDPAGKMLGRLGDTSRGLVETGRSTSDATAGLLSIAVSFETPGRPVHLAADTREAPRVTFTVYPQGAGESARRLGRGVVLLVLLAGLLRLGLLAAMPGRGALQALLLGGAAALAAGIFVHPVGLVAALAAGLYGIRRGPLA